MTGLGLYLGLGAVAGLVAGLLGVGGGLIIVPVLLWLFEGQGIGGPYAMHLAVGTSLGTIVFTSLSSVRAHHRRGAVAWAVFARMTPGIVVGGLAGAAFAGALGGRALEVVFGLFELAVAARMAWGARPAPHRGLPGRAGLTAAGGVIGAFSALVGIGGGTLTVPFLVWCNLTMQRAVATSAACGLPIAAAGAVGFVVAGWDAAGLPAGSFGFLYLPALLGIVLASVLLAPVGARIAHAVPGLALRRAFAVFLVAAGLGMAFGWP